MRSRPNVQINDENNRERWFLLLYFYLLNKIQDIAHRPTSKINIQQAILMPTSGCVLEDRPTSTLRFSFGPKGNRIVNASLRTRPIVGTGLQNFQQAFYSWYVWRSSVISTRLSTLRPSAPPTDHLWKHHLFNRQSTLKSSSQSNLGRLCSPWF